MNYKLNNEAPILYEHWIDSGRIIIPCLKGKPIIKNWQDPSLKISKENGKQNTLIVQWGYD